MDGLIPIEIDGKIASRYNHWIGGKEPKFGNHLRTWGEAGTVKIKTIATPKLGDRGVQCMFVGYAVDHAGDCYRMWDPRTGRVHESRDIIWLKRMFFTKNQTPGSFEIIPVIDYVPIASTNSDIEKTVDQEILENQEQEAGEGNTFSEVPYKTTRSGRRIAIPERYREIGAFAAERGSEDEYESETESGHNFVIMGEVACVGAGIGGGFVNTNELHVMKYQQAMETEDKEQ